MRSTPARLLTLFFTLLAGALHARENEVVDKLPAFTLKDAHGTAQTQAALTERGAVLILTIPNVKHDPFQTRWAKLLTAKGWKRDGPKLVFIEDFSQAKAFEQVKAREQLAERYQPPRNPLILFDEDGKVRSALGITDDETVVLVIDAAGKVVHFAEGQPSPEAAAKILEAASAIRLRK